MIGRVTASELFLTRSSRVSSSWESSATEVYPIAAPIPLSVCTDRNSRATDASLPPRSRSRSALLISERCSRLSERNSLA